jgi:hypothetical protein
MQFLDDAPGGSELERWETEGERREYSNVTSWVDPEEQYLLEFTYDDPVDGFLLRLFRLPDSSQESPRSSERRIAQTLHVDEEATLQAAARLAAAADELDAVDEDPTIGPEYPDMEAVLHPDYTPAPPEEWEDRPEEWEEKMKEAKETAGEQWGRPTLSRKEIDGREYFYLQWRHEDEVQTQYVGPVEPAD